MATSHRQPKRKGHLSQKGSPLLIACINEFSHTHTHIELQVKMINYFWGQPEGNAARISTGKLRKQLARSRRAPGVGEETPPWFIYRMVYMASVCVSSESTKFKSFFVRFIVALVNRVPCLATPPHPTPICCSNHPPLFQFIVAAKFMRLR